MAQSKINRKLRVKNLCCNIFVVFLKCTLEKGLGGFQHPMILKLLITWGYITLIPKEATQEKQKETLKLQPEKLEKKEK